MDAQVIKNFFRHFPLFDCLSPLESDYLAEHADYRTAGKHDFIYLTDDPSDYFFLLVKGTVKTGVHTLDGREVIKNLQHPFTFFGELGLAGETARTEFAACMNSEVGYIAIHTSDVKKLMSVNSEFSQAVLLYIGERLRKAERQWESLILKDVRSRIISFLKDSADQRGRQVGMEMLVKHSLTQQDIANLVGASRQTVTAVMNDLRKSNMIHFNRNTILIRDIDKLN